MQKTKILTVIYSILILCYHFGIPDIFAQAFQGYTLFAPNNSTSTYLYNMNNTAYHTWTHTRSGGYSVYMIPDGSIYRSAVYGSSFNGGGATGMVQKVSWSGTTLWEYSYSTSAHRSHHDICPMPNGNVLLIAWESKTSAECVQAGLNHSGNLWPDHIVEVQPVGTTGGLIVWEWHFWDHLIQDYDATKNNYGVVANHPELFDINVGSSQNGDWMHCNAINFNSDRNEIVICSHNLDELYVIDHSTTTAEAAGHTGGTRGHGGDFLYRWGRASNYRVTSSPQVFDVVHCAVWIPAGYPGAGNIMAFNNRETQGTSQIVEIIPPYDANGNYVYTVGTAYGPSAPTWTYTASGFFSVHLGGCQRLPNGNTIICQSTSGYMFEVNTAGTVQWSYNRGGEIVRALRYPTSYLTDIEQVNSSLPEKVELLQNYPNPFNPSTTVKYTVPYSMNVTVKIYDMLGKEIVTLVNNESKKGGEYELVWNGTNSKGLQMPSGTYFCRLEVSGQVKVQKLVLMK
jgi:hypothetical protein